MWNRRRTWLLLLGLIGVALAVYFEPSHCVRGWLWGEAFFEGRPTSYWRQEIDRWIARHPSREEAQSCKWRIHIHFDPIFAGAEDVPRGNMGMTLASPQGNQLWELDIHHYPRLTAWERAERWWRRIPTDPRPDPELPLVLSGLKDAEAVWAELESAEAYRPFVQRARTFAVCLGNDRKQRVNGAP